MDFCISLPALLASYGLKRFPGELQRPQAAQVIGISDDFGINERQRLVYSADQSLVRQRPAIHENRNFMDMSLSTSTDARLECWRGAIALTLNRCLRARGLHQMQRGNCPASDIAREARSRDDHAEQDVRAEEDKKNAWTGRPQCSTPTNMACLCGYFGINAAGIESIPQ